MPTFTWQTVVADGEGPGARSRHSLVYDTSEGAIVLSGGAVWLDGGRARLPADTWELRDRRWSSIYSPQHPCGRHRGAMVFDEAPGLLDIIRRPEPEGSATLRHLDLRRPPMASLEDLVVAPAIPALRSRNGLRRATARDRPLRWNQRARHCAGRHLGLQRLLASRRRPRTPGAGTPRWPTIPASKGASCMAARSTTAAVRHSGIRGYSANDPGRRCPNPSRPTTATTMAWPTTGRRVPLSCWKVSQVLGASWYCRHPAGGPRSLSRSTRATNVHPWPGTPASPASSSTAARPAMEVRSSTRPLFCVSIETATSINPARFMPSSVRTRRDDRSLRRRHPSFLS